MESRTLTQSLRGSAQVENPFLTLSALCSSESISSQRGSAAQKKEFGGSKVPPGCTPTYPRCMLSPQARTLAVVWPGRKVLGTGLIISAVIGVERPSAWDLANLTWVSAVPLISCVT